MVKIDKDKCIGCGACVSVMPDVFNIKNMKAVVKDKNFKGDIKEAIEICPVEAISE